MSKFGKYLVSLVMPCKNEGEALKDVLKRIPEGVWEVIVVDNGSSDNTQKVAKEFGARVIEEPRSIGGIGYGFALASGIKAASGDVIVCMDGDGSYPIEDITKLVERLYRSKADFISCSRLPLIDPKKMSGVRTFGVRILNLFIKSLYGCPITDSLTGMWVFRRNIIPQLSLFEGGWNFSLEIKLNVIGNPNLKFTEAHIPYHDRVFNESKQSLLKTGFGHLGYLIQKRFTLSSEYTAIPRLSLLEP